METSNIWTGRLLRTQNNWSVYQLRARLTALHRKIPWPPLIISNIKSRFCHGKRDGLPPSDRSLIHAQPWMISDDINNVLDASHSHSWANVRGPVGMSVPALSVWHTVNAEEELCQNQTNEIYLWLSRCDIRAGGGAGGGTWHHRNGLSKCLDSTLLQGEHGIGNYLIWSLIPSHSTSVRYSPDVVYLLNCVHLQHIPGLSYGRSFRMISVSQQPLLSSNSHVSSDESAEPRSSWILCISEEKNRNILLSAHIDVHKSEKMAACMFQKICDFLYMMTTTG